MGHKSVQAMLDSVSSREITQWMAYEQEHGPIDGGWRDEQLATLVELLQQNTYVTGGTGNAKSNPAPKPKPVTRPWALHKKMKQQANSSNFGQVVLDDGEVNPF